MQKNFHDSRQQQCQMEGARLARNGGPGSRKRQSPEEIHGLIRWAVGQRRPMRALYHDLERFLCPHRLGWNRKGDQRVLSYQYGGESETGLGPPGAKENWRCMAVQELSDVELLEGSWHTAETTRARRTALSESKSMSMINRSTTDKMGSKGVAAKETWQSPCVSWQSNRHYVARDGSGDPRGRKPGHG